MTRSGFKPLRGRLGQRKMKSRPSPLFRFHPDLSAVACNDALYDCKTQACTILVLPIFQPLELFEYFFMVPGVNPDAVITYAKLVELLLAFIPDFDFRGLGLSRKLDGIDHWLDVQKKHWSCPDCGTSFSWYTTACSKCGRSLASKAHNLSGWKRLLCRFMLAAAYRKGRTENKIVERRQCS